MLRRIMALAIVLGGTATAETAERIALVVGNGGYQAIGPLDNPVSDAVLIGDSLREVGFEVTTLLDTGQMDLKRGIAPVRADAARGRRGRSRAVLLRRARRTVLW